jgi:hypothetical protein
LERYIESRCRDILASEAVQASLQARLDQQRREMEAEVDKELADERAHAMHEKLAKEAAIRAKQDELHRLQASQRDEVCFHLFEFGLQGLFTFRCWVR